ncbi:MAG: hypothetical protein R3E97_01860 [Candidatus Eisenbacteria bacterium]
MIQQHPGFATLKEVIRQALASGDQAPLEQESVHQSAGEIVSNLLDGLRPSERGEFGYPHFEPRLTTSCREGSGVPITSQNFLWYTVHARRQSANGDVSEWSRFVLPRSHFDYSLGPNFFGVEHVTTEVPAREEWVEIEYEYWDAVTKLDIAYTLLAPVFSVDTRGILSSSEREVWEFFADWVQGMYSVGQVVVVELERLLATYEQTGDVVQLWDGFYRQVGSAVFESAQAMVEFVTGRVVSEGFVRPILELLIRRLAFVPEAIGGVGESAQIISTYNAFSHFEIPSERVALHAGIVDDAERFARLRVLVLDSDGSPVGTEEPEILGDVLPHCEEGHFVSSTSEGSEWLSKPLFIDRSQATGIFARDGDMSCGLDSVSADTPALVPGESELVLRFPAARLASTVLPAIRCGKEQTVVLAGENLLGVRGVRVSASEVTVRSFECAADGSEVLVNLGVADERPPEEFELSLETHHRGTVTAQIPVECSISVAIEAPANGQVVRTGDIVEFRATAMDQSGVDVSDDVDWYWISSRHAGYLGTSRSLSVRYLGIGEHRIKAQAQVPDDPSRAGSDEVWISVTPDVEFEVFVRGPEDESRFFPGDLVEFEAIALDTLGNEVEAVDWGWWSSLDGSIGSTRAFSWSALSTGRHEIRVTGRYHFGQGVEDSKTVGVVVRERAIRIASLAPSDGDEAEEGVPIRFLGHAEDQDGNAVDALWRWTSDTDGELGTTSDFVRSDLSVGPHVVTVVANDPEVPGVADTLAFQLEVLDASYHWAGSYTVQQVGPCEVVSGLACGRIGYRELAGRTGSSSVEMLFAEVPEQGNLRLNVAFGGSFATFQGCLAFEVDARDGQGFSISMLLNEYPTDVTFLVDYSFDDERGGHFEASIHHPNEDIPVAGVWSVRKRRGLFGKCVNPEDGSICRQVSGQPTPDCLDGCDSHPDSEECLWTSN